MQIVSSIMLFLPAVDFVQAKILTTATGNYRCGLQALQLSVAEESNTKHMEQKYGRRAIWPHRPRKTLPLLSRFYPRRDEADIVYASLMSEVDNLGNLTEVEVFVALHKHDLLLPGRKDLRQLGLDLCLVH
jgi:hypothetical protein